MDELYSGETILQVVLLTLVIGGGAAALSGRASRAPGGNSGRW